MSAVAVVALASASLSVLSTGARADTSPPAGEPETVTATPLPTWQTNGTVWSMAIVNGVTYIGGNFTHVRPPGSAAGQNEVERRHLAAFNTTTGDLLPWAPKLTSPPQTFTGTPDANCNALGNGTYECASVWSVKASPDNTKLYVGGAFQAVDGKARSFIAAFNLPSGALDTTFKPQANGRVYAVAPTNNEVYFGGSFTKVNGLARTRFAAATKANVLLPWAPSADAAVTAMVLAPDNSRVVVGGRFNTLNGTSRHGIGAIYTAGTGDRAPWSGDQMISAAYTTSLTMVDNLVYTTGDALGSLSEGIQAIDPYTGATVWNDACRGASHSMAVVRGVVYAGSHAHDCGGMVDGFGEQYQGYPLEDGNRYKLRAEIPNGDGRAKLLHWFPHTNDGNGPRSMVSDGNTLWIGGEFTLINDNLNQQGLTRFTFKDQGGVNMAPLRPVSVVAGAETPEKVDIAWQATPDRDNRRLTYQVIKNDNVNNPIATATADGRPWSQPWMSVVDTNVTPGATYSYTIRAVDPDGRLSVRSYPVSVTVPTADVQAKDLAKTAGATANYRFEESSGTTISSTVGGRTALLGTRANLGGAGALGTSLTLQGSSGGVAVDGAQKYAKRQATVEAMFKTSTTRGGSLLSVGNSSSRTGTSSNTRNLLYMSNDGRLNWGFRPDSWTFPNGPSSGYQAVTTPAGYNDNKWHHVVATFEPGTGARIYVDGDLVAQNAALNWSRTYNSYLRIGADSTNNYPNRPSSDWWAGSIDEVAAYDYPLSNRQIRSHADAFLGRPAAPTGLSGTATGESSINVTWNASAGATSYNVIRNGTKVGTATTPSFSDSGLTANTSYQYSVVAVNAVGTGGESKTITVKTDAKAPVTLLTRGSSWKYETSGVETSGWKAPSFDDSGWASGPAEIGHGEGDEVTAITPFMSNGTTRRITTYLRTHFNVADPAEVQQLNMLLKRDDGVVIYLNGDEVYRDLMPAGAINAETLASTYAPDDGQTFRTVNGAIPVSKLVQGENVITVEIHQNARSSLDLSFDMELTGLR